MLLLRSCSGWSVVFTGELACKLQTIPKLMATNSNSVGSLTCIILLLLGSVQYHPYIVNLSVDSSAYGQEQSVEVEDGRLSIELGQEQAIDDEGSEDRSLIDDDDEISIPTPSPIQDTVS